MRRTGNHPLRVFQHRQIRDLINSCNKHLVHSKNLRHGLKILINRSICYLNNTNCYGLFGLLEDPAIPGF